MVVIPAVVIDVLVSTLLHLKINLLYDKQQDL